VNRPHRCAGLDLDSVSTSTTGLGSQIAKLLPQFGNPHGSSMIDLTWSPPRKRGCRASQKTLQPWIPAFAGVTIKVGNRLIYLYHFGSGSKGRGLNLAIAAQNNSPNLDDTRGGEGVAIPPVASAQRELGSYIPAEVPMIDKLRHPTITSSTHLAPRKESLAKSRIEIAAGD
jgi:hypothetical protein